MPSGGPPDQTPPEIEMAEPAAGAVNVTAEAVRLTFSEPVEQSSFTRALAVTPEPEGRLDVRWKGRSVEIRFPEPLRDNTTYILTLDTGLRDLRGVSLRQPLTLAFSTGPVINKGKIAGRVLGPQRGQPVAEIDVYAYAAPDSVAPAPLPERPDYRTQTDAQGRFRFDYLNEQPYFVVALEDRNRNRQPDALERYAVPPRAVIFADSTGGEMQAPWLVAVKDTLAPELQRVQALSDRRLELRFSEPVRLTSRSPRDWLLEDSLAAAAVALDTLYTRPDEARLVYLLTAPLREIPYRLRPENVVDTTGTEVGSAWRTFTPRVRADTMQVRFLGFAPEGLTANEAGRFVLSPQARPGVRFNQPVDVARLRTLVAVEDTTGQALEYAVETPDGTTFFFETTPPLASGQVVRVRMDARALAGADTTSVRVFERISARELGSITGVVKADSTGVALVELYAAGTQEPRRTEADAGGRFAFPDLPAGQYRLRAFLDRDGDRRWSGGLVVPYERTEPLAWGADTLRVRARWETALPDTLSILDF